MVGTISTGAQANPERDSLGPYETLRDDDMDWLMGKIAGENKPDTTVDPSVITFKFKPYYSTIKLKYVFASEEYKYDVGGPGGGKRAEDVDRTGEAKADIMGIFVKRFPSQQDADMVVSITGNTWPGQPNKSPVCIKFVNHNVNEYAYNTNKDESFIFDGFTDPLNIDCWKVDVTPCQTYWIKIGVADYPNGDPVPGQHFTLSHQINSAVFLEAGSLISGAGMEWEVSGQIDNQDFENDTALVEGGCSNMIITLAKNVPTLDTVWLRFKIDGADTSEYTVIPAPKDDSLLGIPPGAYEFNYMITAIDDGIPEGNGQEPWKFRYQMNPCDIPGGGGWGTGSQGYSGTIFFKVFDYEPLVSATKTYGPVPSSIYYCGNEVTLNITDIVEGGIPPFNYIWSQPSTGQIGMGENFTVTITGNPDISICNISDRCTNLPAYPLGKDSVFVYSTLLAQASPAFQLCENLNWPITIENTNVGNDFTVAWYFQGNLVGTSLVYTVSWDDYYQYYGVLDTLYFNYVVTDNCGNTTTGSVIAVWDPIVQISGTPVICLGEEMVLTCTQGQSYQWYMNSVSPGNLIPGATFINYNFTPSAAGLYTVCVEIINACNEPASTCFDFEVSELTCDILMNGATDFTVCPGLAFDLEEMNAFTDWQWSWSDNGQTHTAIGKIIQLSLLDPGLHQITVSAYNEHGCFDERQFPVTVFPYTQLQLFTEFESVCSGYPTQLSAQSAINAVSYNWTADPHDNSLTGQQNDPAPTVTPAQNTVYTCAVTDVNGCQGEKTIAVEVRPPITGYIAANPAASCIYDEVRMAFAGIAQSYATYAWTFEGGDPPAGSTPQLQVRWNEPGIKNITLVIDEPGCTETFNYQLTVFPLPQPMISVVNNAGCSPLEVQFQNESQELDNPTYWWDFGDGTTSQEYDPVHVYESPGLYDVTLTVNNATGCDSTKTFPDVVEVYPSPEADFIADPLAATIDHPEISFYEQISGSFSYIRWDFGDGDSSLLENPVHNYTAPGFYDVNMYTESIHGCWDTVSLQISITEELKVYIPTAFTPNGDGLNDCFVIKGTTSDIIDNFHVIIYHRWGQIVYQSIIDSPDCVWDGRGMDGEQVAAGTYVYKIYGTDYRGTKQKFEGLITIVK